MALIAQKNEFVEDADGIRRLVAAGSPLPLNPTMDVGSDKVDNRELVRAHVDEEGAKSHADRTGAKQRNPREGLTNTVDELRSSGRRSKQQPKE